METVPDDKDYKDTIIRVDSFENSNSQANISQCREIKGSPTVENCFDSMLPLTSTMILRYYDIFDDDYQNYDNKFDCFVDISILTLFITLVFLVWL